MSKLINLKNIFPVLGNLVSSYGRSDFNRDLFAGLTVGVIFIPQGMAYAMLAGVPPIYGLYAGLFPLLLYALFGTSRQLSIGPVAVSALLVLAGISTIAEPFSPEYITYVILTGFCIGVLQILAGIFKLGFLVNFLSHPVIAGFSSAAAIIIVISQLKDVFGFPIPRMETSAEYLLYAFSHLDETHWLTLSICLGSLAIIYLLRYINKKIPAALLVAIVATALTYFFRWDQEELSIIGDISRGLPSFEMVELDRKSILAVLPTVLTVAIIGTVECIGIAKVLEAKTKNHIVIPNRELIALGISKTLGSLFQAMPTSGSFSRSAVNHDAHASTQISSIITVILIALTLIFLTPFFYYMPLAVLAAIILQSVTGLFDYKEAIHLWKVHRLDFIMMMTTFVITLVLGIEEGVFAGVALSVVTVLYKSTKPHTAKLGNIPNTPFYRNVERFQDVEPVDEIIIIRFDDQLFFGNVSYFKERMKNYIAEHHTKPKYCLLDCGNIHDLDSSGAHGLQEIENYLLDQGIELHVASVRGPMRDMLYKCGMMTEPHKHHMTVHAGVQTITGTAERTSFEQAMQKNR
ncbi:MAG: solute carrier family 26 protein [Bacteroidia bacterium]|nr:solute carrier family 26 protein [Bacteroidia bacterium]